MNYMLIALVIELFAVLLIFYFFGEEIISYNLAIKMRYAPVVLVFMLLFLQSYIEQSVIAAVIVSASYFSC